MTGSTTKGKVFFNVIFRPKDGKEWIARHNLTGAQYQAEFKKHTKAGFKLRQVESYRSGSSIGYAAIFRKDSGPAFTAYHGVSATDHQNRFNSLTKKGWRPKNISVTSINGKRFYAALYDKGPSGSLLAKSFLTGSQYQQQSNANKSAGRQLLGGAAVHLSGTIVAPVPLSMGCTLARGSELA